MFSQASSPSHTLLLKHNSPCVMDNPQPKLQQQPEPQPLLWKVLSKQNIPLAVSAYLSIYILCAILISGAPDYGRITKDTKSETCSWICSHLRLSLIFAYSVGALLHWVLEYSLDAILTRNLTRDQRDSYLEALPAWKPYFKLINVITITWKSAVCSLDRVFSQACTTKEVHNLLGASTRTTL